VAGETVRLTSERRWWRTGLAAATVAILCGLILVQVSRAPETYPWGDTAITSITTLRAARGNLATGAYSRFLWNHPGPLLYQMLAPFYRLSGNREITIKWTVLILNVGALAGLLSVVARPAAFLSLMIALALAPLIYREQRLLFWAWNPIVPLLPMAFATALSARIAAGRLAFLPLFCAIASFAVQTHVGFAPVVLSLSATMIIMLAWRLSRRRFAPAKGEIARSILIAGAVAALLWAVPVVHELTTSDRNLSALVRFFSTTPPPARGWGTTFGIAANQMIGPLAPGWKLTTDIEAPSDASWPIVTAAAIQFPLLLGAGVLAFRRGAVFEGAFALTVLMASVAGVLAVHAIVGPVSDYLVIWLAVLGALNLASIVSEALHIGLDVERRSRVWRWILVAYTLAAAMLGSTRLVGKHATDARSNIVPTLTASLERYCRQEGIDRPLLRFRGPAWQVAVGMVLQFYKAGRPIALPDETLFLVGDPFRATGRESGEFYLMTMDDTALPADITRHLWVTTYGSYRLVRLFRE
jgi:hypothetical protein